MNAEPNNVNTKNLILAYSLVSIWFFNPATVLTVLSPQIPIMKYIGKSTISKNTKNNIKSNATKVPFIPVSRTSINARNPFGLFGSGKCSIE